MDILPGAMLQCRMVAPFCPPTDDEAPKVVLRSNMKFALRWSISFAVTAVLCFLSVLFIDVPVERLFSGVRKYYPGGLVIGAAPLVGAIVLVALFYGAKRWRGRAPSLGGQVAILAAVSSLAALAICDLMLKPLFGRLPVDGYLLHDWHSGFRLFHGNRHSSFPSGHAAIAAPVLTILWRFFPQHRRLYTAALTGISAILVAGYWHFVSDIFAGTFVGASTAIASIALGQRYRLYLERTLGQSSLDHEINT